MIANEWFGGVESIQPLIGISRWSMDLIAYLVDDLFQLARAVGDRVGDREYIRSIGKIIRSFPTSISG